MSRVHALAALVSRPLLSEAARTGIVTACALALALAGPVLPHV
jgi:hypothetical protein